MSAPPLTVVCVVHDSAPDLERLLGSIERHLPERPQLVVADSGSRDDGATVARAHGAEVVVLEGNPGFGAGSNAGVRRASAEVTALLNPDVELLDDGLLRLAELARERDVIVAPRLLGNDGRPQDSAHPRAGTLDALGPALLPRRLLPPGLRVRAEPWRSELPRPVGWAIGACLVARTALLRRLGPFDAEAFLFYEDLELCLRAERAGVPVWLHPEVALRHRGGTSTNPALGGEALGLRARRRREVMAREGRARLALDDAAQALTFATRAAGRRLTGRGGQRERAQLQALLRARSAPPG